MAEQDKTRSKNIVYSIQKAFRVLEAFTDRDPELLLSEVARRAHVDNATAFRMLNTLVLLGYVEKIPEGKRFRLSLKCLDLGFSAIARMDLRSMAKPVLHDLVSKGAGAASIGIIDKGDVLYIERVQLGMTRLAVDIRVGTRIPAFCSAIGRAILAYLPPQQQRRELDQRPREKLTPWTITHLDKLAKSLHDARAQGFAVVDQESVVGLTAIAAPILGSDELPIAAVSVAMPSSAMSVDQFTGNFAISVCGAASTLSRGMQASGGIAGGA